MLDYIGLKERLYQAQAETGAAECHGFLCGQVCVSTSPAENTWQEFLDVQSNDDELITECYRYITLLLADIIDGLRSPDLDFQLLLPEEDCTVTRRIEALTGWCHGFLNGYGAGSEEGKASMAEECLEVLDDFTRICRVEIEPEESEESEQAFMELSEYVRMGVIYIFDEMSPGMAPDDKLERLH
ncbi:MAG: UPF0149 family protein [Gammaproteobacteria bacterium]